MDYKVFQEIEDHKAKGFPGQRYLFDPFIREFFEK